MENYQIVVFDVGKTNKKILLFDQDLKLMDSVYESFDVKNGEQSGIEIEDIENSKKWFFNQIKIFAEKYQNIKAISITTHGATCACIDKNGELAVPVYSYTTDPGEGFEEDFFNEYGDPFELQKSTATPVMGNFLTLGKFFHYLKKHYPQEFNNINDILFFPQYYGYLLTGNIAAELTFIGCHTYLWDFIQNKYSAVAEKLGILEKLPEDIKKPWDVLGNISSEIAEMTGLKTDTIVTLGIHDSNSSLLPYLVKIREKFVLNSTGTWCVAMHPAEKTRFEEEDLGKTVFYNIDAFKNPVKTAIFMGGLEFETYNGIFKMICDKKELPEFDPEHYAQIIKEKQLFILPSVVKGTGQFPQALPRVFENGEEYPLEDIQEGQAVPEFFTDYKTAYAVLNISLAVQTYIACNTAGMKNGMSLFVEGGFRNNYDYNALLTALYPESKIALTSLNEATAFGAAMLGKCAVEKSEPAALSNLFEIEINPVEKIEIPGMDEYIKEFISFLD